MAIRFKQLFPRVPKQSAGPFELPRDLMVAADLEWFLARYPLHMTVEDQAALLAGKALFDVQQAELERILLPDYVPPAIPGLREGEVIRHYQQQAIQLLRRRRGLLLGDEGGLGKTYTAAGFLCAEPGALPAAVVCDPHMQKQWRDKIQAFTNLKVHIIKQAKPYDLPPADVYIFRISQILGWTDIFATDFFRAMVIDEPQSLRTGTGTAKGGAAKVLYEHTLYHLGLTATPIYNYGVEMWNVMQFIDDTVLGSYADFCREWVDNNGHITDPKALGTYLREQHVMLRRLKSDVGLELPKVSRIVEYVDYDAKAVESIEEMARRLAIRATTGAFVERGQAARELDMMVRQATGVSKAKSVAQFVRLMVAAGEPVLLMGWHRAVYDIWLEELKDLRPAMYIYSDAQLLTFHLRILGITVVREGQCSSSVKEIGATPRRFPTVHTPALTTYAYRKHIESFTQIDVADGTVPDKRPKSKRCRLDECAARFAAAYRNPFAISRLLAERKW
ncbi:SWI/SNF family helicase [Burkholderia sp. AU4i]|nr:SWI/SNF family helicase [Burkholderia sp. AU4i]